MHNKRAISPIISIILLIVITISIASTSYIFLNNLLFKQLSKSKENIEEIYDISLLQITNIYWYDYRDGLVLELRFDDCGNLGQNLQDGYKLKDYSGNDNDGIAYNGPKCVKGVIGKALEFDGGDDYVNIGNPIAGKKLWTIALWFKTDDTRDGGTYWTNPTLIGVGTPGGDSNDFGLEIKGGKIGMYGGLDNDSADEYAYKGPFVADSRWHFVVVINDGNYAKIYLDGNLTSNVIPTGDPLVNDWMAVAGLGGGHINDAIKFEGIIDEVRIYNKALSPDIIKDLFYRVQLVVYNPTDKPINLNGTYYSIGDCIFKLIYNETFITASGDYIMYPHKQDIIKLTNIRCHLERYKDHDVCLIYGSRKVCGRLEVQ